MNWKKEGSEIPNAKMDSNDASVTVRLPVSVSDADASNTPSVTLALEVQVQNGMSAESSFDSERRHKQASSFHDQSSRVMLFASHQETMAQAEHQ